MGGNTLSRIVERSHIISKSQTASQSLDPSAAARLERWKVGLEIFYKHHLIGVGYNNYGTVYLISLAVSTNFNNFFILFSNYVSMFYYVCNYLCCDQ